MRGYQLDFGGAPAVMPAPPSASFWSCYFLETQEQFAAYSNMAIAYFTRAAQALRFSPSLRIELPALRLPAIWDLPLLDVPAEAKRKPETWREQTRAQWRRSIR